MWIYCKEVNYAINLDNTICFRISRAELGKYIEIKNVKEYIVSAYIDGESWFICSVDTEQEAQEIILKLAKAQRNGKCFDLNGDYM